MTDWKNRTVWKTAAAAVMTACLCLQPGLTAMAEEIGPGFSDMGPGYETEAWKKLDGIYMDDQGNAIEGAVQRGISVSKFQGTIDWSRVAQDDVSFAFIRMVSYGYEGGYTMDETFDRNMREASANGIHTAPYIYLQTRTVEEARQAAQFAVDTARNYTVDFPIAVDVESQYIMDLSVQELTDVVNAFCQVIADAGYTPIIYSDYYKFTNEMDTSQFGFDLWMARYGGDHRYPGRTIWQCTDQGQVDGIEGNVCLEFAFKDYNAAAPGAVSDGWKQEPDGNWYYYRGGSRVTGWLQDGAVWYYLDPGQSGAMVSGTSMVIDGTEYAFDGSGAML